MFNNLKLINKAFDYIINEEKKLNYEYEPHFEEHDENWKRHLFFFELKKDFIKDVTEFGFCPYIQKPCEEQRRDKNIMRFQKIDNFVRTDYIKNLYKKITANTNRKIKREKSLSPKRTKFTLIVKKNKSMKDIGIGHTNKFNYENNTFLSKIYTKIKNRKREINNLKLGKNINLNLNKNIVKQNNDNIDNLLGKKSNKNEDGQMEAESFIYEPDKNHMKYNNFYALNREKSKDTNNKDDSLSNSSNNNNNEDNDNKDSNSLELINGEIKKKGWKMTTSLEGDKLFRNLKGSFPLHKNVDNHKNYNPETMIRTNKIIINSKVGKGILKNNFTGLKLNKNHSGKNSKSAIFCKKIENNGKKKDKKFKLFFHVRKFKNELQNDF